MMSNRLEILQASLLKKQALFNSKIQEHFDTVKQSNGQPLNDKRNGRATMNRWERQNNSLRSLKESIEVTKNAIEKEQSKVNNVKNTELPSYISDLIESGMLVQWRRHPTFFFVAGVEKARIHLLENGAIEHRYVKEIKDQEQYAKFRDVFNGLNKKLREIENG